MPGPSNYINFLAEDSEDEVEYNDDLIVNIPSILDLYDSDCCDDINEDIDSDRKN